MKVEKKVQTCARLTSYKRPNLTPRCHCFCPDTIEHRAITLTHKNFWWEIAKGWEPGPKRQGWGFGVMREGALWSIPFCIELLPIFCTLPHFCRFSTPLPIIRIYKKGVRLRRWWWPQLHSLAFAAAIWQCLEKMGRDIWNCDKTWPNQLPSCYFLGQSHGADELTPWQVSGFSH